MSSDSADIVRSVVAFDDKDDLSIRRDNTLYGECLLVSKQRCESIA
jgi:hypothetical protein